MVSYVLPVYAMWHPKGKEKHAHLPPGKLRCADLKCMLLTNDRLPPAIPSCQVMTTPLAPVKDLHSSTQHEHIFSYASSSSRVYT